MLTFLPDVQGHDGDDAPDLPVPGLHEDGLARADLCRELPHRRVGAEHARGNLPAGHHVERNLPDDLLGGLGNSQQEVLGVGEGDLEI
eukprot:16434762-Heterocapsa_arctica.AAC.1